MMGLVGEALEFAIGGLVLSQAANLVNGPDYGKQQPGAPAPTGPGIGPKLGL